MARRWNNANSWNSAFKWNGQPIVLNSSNVRDHRRVVVEISKGLTLLRFSDGEFIDRDMALVLLPRLSRTVTFERRVSTAYWTSSGRNFTAIGNIELINCDGGLDSLLSDSLKDADITIKVGSTAMPYSQFLTVATGVLDKVEAVGEDRLRIIVADTSRKFDAPIRTLKPLSGTSVNDLYPVALGLCGQVPVMHTGVPDLKYSVHDIPISIYAGDVSEIRDSGAVLTPFTQWLESTASPSFGFELLQATVGKITATLTSPGPANPSNNARFAAQLKYLLQTRFGLSDLQLDIAGLDEIQSSNLGTLGRYVFDEATYGRALDEYADSIGGWWHVDLSGTLKIQRLSLPSPTLSPEIVVSKLNLVGDIQVDDDLAPGLSNALLGGVNWAPLSESEQATSVRDTDEGRLQRKRYRWRKEFTVHAIYQRNIDSQGNVRDSNSDERLNGMPTLWYTEAALNSEIPLREALWDGPKAFFRCKVNLHPSQVAALDIGSIVQFELPRYGLDAVRSTLLGVRGEAGKNEVELYSWGVLPPLSLGVGGGKS